VHPWDAATQEIYRQKLANSFRLKPKPPIAEVGDALIGIAGKLWRWFEAVQCLRRPVGPVRGI